MEIPTEHFSNTGGLGYVLMFGTGIFAWLHSLTESEVTVIMTVVTGLMGCAKFLVGIYKDVHEMKENKKQRDATVVDKPE